MSTNSVLDKKKKSATLKLLPKSKKNMNQQ